MLNCFVQETSAQTEGFTTVSSTHPLLLYRHRFDSMQSYAVASMVDNRISSSNAASQINLVFRELVPPLPPASGWTASSWFCDCFKSAWHFVFYMDYIFKMQLQGFRIDWCVYREYQVLLSVSMEAWLLTMRLPIAGSSVYIYRLLLRVLKKVKSFKSIYYYNSFGSWTTPWRSISIYCSINKNHIFITSTTTNLSCQNPEQPNKYTNLSQRRKSIDWK